MNKILITGGSGTVGKAFIRKYYNDYEFHNLSRNELAQVDLKREFPKVHNHIASVENLESVLRIFDKVRPDIVIHSAAMKHVDTIESEAIQACNVNVVGSLNIITASTKYDVGITIGISTDKACSSESIYGDTKSLMEKCFMNASTKRHRFSICRFANVAHSNGSVLPFWLESKERGESLKLTDPTMNRLMFSQEDAAMLIHNTLVYTQTFENDFVEGGFVCTTKMKTVNMLDLAKAISDDIEIVGKRPGEKVNEDLVSEKELPYTIVIHDYIIIGSIVSNDMQLSRPYNSESAEKMSEVEIKKLIFTK